MADEGGHFGLTTRLLLVLECAIRGGLDLVIKWSVCLESNVFFVLGFGNYPAKAFQEEKACFWAPDGTLFS